MRKILIADDDRNLLRILGKVLSKSGFEVATCENGEEAKVMASSAMYDLVVLDISMEGLSGLEAARTINYSNPNQKIVIFSAYSTNPETRKELEKLNVVAVLQKPLSPLQFRDRISELLHKGNDP